MLVALDENFLDVATSNLGFALARLARLDEGASRALLKELTALTDDAFLRLVKAPQLFFRLGELRQNAGVERVQSVATFLVDCIEGERRLEEKGSPRTSAVWTALGDWYFPAGQSAVNLSRDADVLIWRSDQVYCAPRLSNGVMVDFASPYGRGKLIEISGDDVSFSLNESRTVVAKLEESVSAMVAICPTAAAMVAYESKAILPRKDSAQARGFRAASTPLCLGRPVLRNPDLPEATIAELVDGLVHETIHCVIDLVEFREPLVLEVSTLASTTVLSPWTGRRLDLNTYLQACLVWYGLWNFWSRGIGAHAIATSVIFRYLAGAAEGFLSADITEPLRLIRGALAPELLDVLGGLQHRVREGMTAVLDCLEEARP
jgi:hypothetical protein